MRGRQPRAACLTLRCDMVKADLPAALFLSALLSGQPQPSPDEFILRADSQLVVVNAGVQDARGTNIQGLTAQAFQIFEDGHLQTIKQFASEDRPVTIGIVIDTSGSMRNKQAEVITAALAFVESSNPKDETFVVDFNDHASLGLPPNVAFSQNRAQLRTALYAQRPEGRTALYDALTLAASHLAKGKWESKALLLISDGGDNNSMHTLQQAVRTVELSGAAVYCVALYDPEEPEHNLGTLHRLSQLTGGEVFVPAQLSEIGALCQRIAKDIRASYTLAYTPPNPDRYTTPRKIRVVVSTPATGKLRVRARTGYILEKQ
jgi:Ca-activated chloride channel family protein